jgi:hypothetical protein
MGTELGQLLEQVREARAKVLDEVVGLSAEDGARKLDDSSWSIQEILEHLVLAERGGFDLICTAARRFRSGDPVWSGTSENAGLPIETVIARTWREREEAPDSATPAGSWDVGIWASHLRNCDDLLSDLPPILIDLPLSEVIYPHFLCGPLNATQRLEFLRFHLDRHLLQIQRTKQALST